MSDINAETEYVRIKIYPPPFCSFKHLDERGWLTMKKGSTLKDALKMIKMPRAAAKIMLVKLNGLSERWDTVLEDGDVIGFFSFISGG